MGNGFRWVTVSSKDELEALYLKVIPKIREAARIHGYAIGVHGSLRRDLDLIAVPWVENPLHKDELAQIIHMRVCGLKMKNYQWEKKPGNRWATCFPICFPSLNDTFLNEPSLGHIDLSVIEW